MGAGVLGGTRQSNPLVGGYSGYGVKVSLEVAVSWRLWIRPIKPISAPQNSMGVVQLTPMAAVLGLQSGGNSPVRFNSLFTPALLRCGCLYTGPCRGESPRALGSNSTLSYSLCSPFGFSRNNPALAGRSWVLSTCNFDESVELHGCN